MSFFSKKQEVDLATVCDLFYENVIFDCVVDGFDVNVAFLDTLRNNLITADKSFASVGSKEFNDEIIILQFELFALVWAHQFGEESLVAQSIFTKKYLHEKKRGDIWEAMGIYQQAIARSASGGKHTNNPSDKLYLLQLDKKKIDLFGKFIEKGYDEESIVRAVGLLLTEVVWSKGITAGFLLLTLCDRLGLRKDFEPSEEAHSRWFVEIKDLYDHGRKTLDKIKIKR